MKNILLLLLILPLLSSQNIQTNNDFVGSWKGDDNGEIGYITFEADGYASFEIEGQRIGGREFLLDGKKGKMTYFINSKKTPIHVDFEITKLDTGESTKLTGIAEFIDKETLQMALEFGGNRPKDFEGENSITLRKLK